MMTWEDFGIFILDVCLRRGVRYPTHTQLKAMFEVINACDFKPHEETENNR